MYKKTIDHHCLELDWKNTIKIQNPKTLVLGSFNPYNKNGKVVDYYYGRSSNHFWQAIAESLGHSNDYFFDKNDGLRRKLEVMQNRFVCMDVIDSIDFLSEEKSAVEGYIEDHVFKNFADQKIWISKTKIDNDRLTLVRHYNKEVINILQSELSIDTIIHTMGAKTMNQKTCSPKEKHLGKEGFDGYIAEIQDISEKKDINFIRKGMSPSAYAIKKASTNRDDLKDFLTQNLHLDS